MILAKLQFKNFRNSLLLLNFLNSISLKILWLKFQLLENRWVYLTKAWRQLQVIIVMTLFALPLQALHFTIQSGSDVVGKLQFYTPDKATNFNAIAQRFDMGYYELVEANPSLNPNDVPAHRVVIIPSQYILPPLSYRHGIVVNLAQLRLFYFDGSRQVDCYPVGIGRVGWETPLGRFHIMQKMKNPVWIAPDSIIKARAKDGVKIPKVVQSGPDNPLGHYALRLSRPTYLLHGNNDPTGVGRRVSSGCLRLYNRDIQHLFSQVKVKTPVTIMDQPYLLGVRKQQFYVETHLPLAEQLVDSSKKKLVEEVLQTFKKNHPALVVKINTVLLQKVVNWHLGIPIDTGKLLHVHF